MRISTIKLESDFRHLGLTEGDTVLIRASLGAVGRVTGGAHNFIESLLNVIGKNGTMVSLAFTSSTFFRRPDRKNAFTPSTESYAGALPNTMLQYDGSLRSRHPLCSYVAIGTNASVITSFHGPDNPAYEPVRKIIELGGKCVLVGCVGSSPGFTTTHLAEYDLGLLNKVIFPWLNQVYYLDQEGRERLFMRSDLGMCSNSFYKFYAHYVYHGILSTGHVGKAYSIAAPASKAYEIDRKILKNDHKYNVCGSPDCFMCNARRWDRIHHAPLFFLRKVFRLIKNRHI